MTLPIRRTMLTGSAAFVLLIGTCAWSAHRTAEQGTVRLAAFYAERIVHDLLYQTLDPLTEAIDAFAAHELAVASSAFVDAVRLESRRAA